MRFASLFPQLTFFASATLLANAAQAGIYTCVDQHGRKLTSDRPIMECLDREQRELNASGTTRRVVPPPLTGPEREAREAALRQAQLEREKARSEAKRNQALLIRYPKPAAHEAARQEALEHNRMQTEMAQKHLAGLEEKHRQLLQDAQPYQKDGGKMPGRLRHALESSEQAITQQKRTLANQQAEADRINASFDAEAARLVPMWQANTARPPVATPR